MIAMRGVDVSDEVEMRLYDALVAASLKERKLWDSGPRTYEEMSDRRVVPKLHALRILGEWLEELGIVPARLSVLDPSVELAAGVLLIYKGGGHWTIASLLPGSPEYELDDEQGALLLWKLSMQGVAARVAEFAHDACAAPPVFSSAG